jgi:hypothetical protein
LTLTRIRRRTGSLFLIPLSLGRAGGFPSWEILACEVLGSWCLDSGLRGWAIWLRLTSQILDGLELRSSRYTCSVDVVLRKRRWETCSSRFFDRWWALRLGRSLGLDEQNDEETDDEEEQQ